MNSIEGNINTINLRMRKAAERAGRNPDELLLVAVTKTRDPEEINNAIECGITDIGENKVQEITDKYEKIQPVQWHMIGHLQTNKVKYIIDKVSLIHSVDSLRLAKEIDKKAGQQGITANILIQVNAANEESKYGIAKQELEPLIRQILDSCENVYIKGLMSIAPFDENPENVRKYFRQVRELYERYGTIDHERLSFKYLSMGMTNDFEVAIEEGSNIIRVGTAIFGPRNYDK